MRSVLLALFLCLPSAARAQTPTTPSPTPAARAIRINGVAARPEDLATLTRLEAAWGQRLPDGDYWYDDKSGVAGPWGGPATAFLGAGLGLSGVAVPAAASGGGTGSLTGVFVNGRELHPTDVQGLTSLLGQSPWPGQWWVDGQGNYGQPGQPAMGNLVAIARQRQATDAMYRSDVTTGSSVYVGSGCTSVSGRLSSSDSSSSYSYYVGCE
jgi:hypothetical protein